MNIIPMFERDFAFDGRGPDLLKVIWADDGKMLKGFEYFNPDDNHTEEFIRHIVLDNVQAFSMAGEEVHGKSLTAEQSGAAIFKIEDSAWLKQFNQAHLDKCGHYQIVFYDEIYDVICGDIKTGRGRILTDKS